MKYTRYFGRRTKIICTIGPATSTDATIERLIKTGMNIARLNLSHGTHSEHAHHIATIRKLAKRLGIPIPILIDLPGPKYRVGRLTGGSVVLKKGALVTLTSRQVEGDEETVPVTLATLPRNAKVGDTVLLDDGAIQLRVREISGTEVNSRVVIGGLLNSGRGVVVPGMRAAGPFVTEHLLEHIDFTIAQLPDYVALSFVSRAEDVSQTRTMLQQKNCDIPIIAKIERGQAVANFNGILEVSDGIMVARGDLGVDMPLQKIPLLQKDIIGKCNQAGKPVITATQMLESMVASARPTRAEVTDIANAIFDGTDAVMLSAETSIGKYPVGAVRIMSQVALETEKRLPYEKLLTERGMWLKPQTDELISYNACHTANRLGAAAIVAFTESGSTAQRLSKYRPRTPILAITNSKIVGGRLQLCWGVQTFQIAKPPSVDGLFTAAAKLSKDLRLAKSGDVIVITGGIPLGVTGTTNLLKVERIP